MDVVLSKRQGCQGVGSRAATHPKTIAYGLAGIGVLFFLFVISYTTWTLSLRANLQQGTNQTADELLTGINDTDLNTVNNVTDEHDVLATPNKTSILVKTTHPFNESARLTPPRDRGGRKRGGRKKMRKNYRKQIHQLLSKLLGSGRVADGENDSAKVRNETKSKRPKKKKKKNNTGRPKYRVVVVPGRTKKKKKNRNTHRKTSPQRPDVGEKRRDRLKGDSSDKSNGRKKGRGCDRKGGCRRHRTQNRTDVNRVNVSRSTPLTTLNEQTENSVKLEDSNSSNITVHTENNKGNRFGKKSNRTRKGFDFQPAVNHSVSPSSRTSKHPCPGENSSDKHEQSENSTGVIPNEHNSNTSQPCLVARCNSTDAGSQRHGKANCSDPEARLSGEGDDDIGTIDGDEVNEGNGGGEEDTDAEVGDRQYGYGDEEKGWKSNMERIFAEFEQERSDDELDALRQVKWNQTKESDTCDLWIRCKYNSLRHYLKQLDELPGCPCLYPDLAWNSQLWDDSKESYFSWETANSAADRSDIYKPGARFCIRSQLEPGMLTLAAQHCCYDNNQQLITRGKAAGTPNLISPQISWELHRKVDILPWIICKGDWYRYHKVVPPNNSVMCKNNPEDSEFYRQVIDLKNI